MNIHDAWKQIRGTSAEKVLLNTHAADGPCSRATYGAGVSDEMSAASGAQRLRELGLAVREASLAGELELTAEGHELATIISQSRHDGPERWDAVQRAMLMFVKDSKPGRAGEIAGAVVDGLPVTEDEAAHAFEYLSQHGLLNSVGAWGAQDLRPEMTSKGRYAIHEPNIRDYVERGFVSQTNYDYSTNTNVTGSNVGAVTGGTGNTTTVHQTIATDARNQVVALARQILDQVPDDAEHAPLRAEVESIRDEVESGTGKRESLMAKAGKAALMAGATAAGQQIVGLLAQIGQAIGS